MSVLTVSETHERLFGAIRKAQRRPDAVISLETTALDVPGWDSLSHSLVILEVEREFATRIPDDKAFALANVGELAALLGIR